MRMLRASMALGTISAMAPVSALPEQKLTKEFLNSEIANVECFCFVDTFIICVIKTKDGFTFVGESACVDPANFNQEIGEKIAYDNAFEKMWFTYGFWLHKVLADHDNRLQPPSDDNKIEAQDVIPEGATFDFGTAVAALKEGLRVAREGWNGKGMFLSLVNTGYYDVGCSVVNDIDSLLPWIGMKTADNKFVPWLASQTDVLAEDWQIVE